MLIELGRAGAVNASLRRRPIDVVAVAREAIHMVERQAQARSISITLEGQAPLPTVGDHVAICQVMVNLLSNAIKYNHEGGWVRLSVFQGESTQIEIQDTART
jgi:signal transduction histidine kinase